MQNNRPCSIEYLLNNNSKSCSLYLNKLYKKIFLILNINNVVKSLLPKPLKYYCRVINIRNNILIIETFSASWKMRLYYEKYKLLLEIKKKIIPSLISIKIKINPNFYKQKFNKKKINKLSINSAKSIKYVSLNSKGKLKILLEKLIKISLKQNN